MNTDLTTLNTTYTDYFDYLVSQLEAKGIYVDLQLHVLRLYPGFSTNCPTPFYKGVDIFYPGMLAPQESYASLLLSHSNPYTGHTYASDPGVAMVEINNEDGLMAEWNYSRFLDDDVTPLLDTSYTSTLQTQWNNWLKAKYSNNNTTLTNAWTASPGYTYSTSLLSNGTFNSGTTTPWNLQVTSPAAANCQVVAGGAPDGMDNAVKLATTGTGPNSWDVQFLQPCSVTVLPGQPLTLSFWAKAATAQNLSVILQQQASPFTVIAVSTASLTPNWQQFTAVLTPTGSYTNVNLSLDNLGSNINTVWASNFVLQTGNTILGAGSAAAEGVLGTTMLTNGTFPSPFGSPWNFQVSGTASASATILTNGNHNGTANALQMDNVVPGAAAWDVQLYQGGLNVTAGQPYTVSFWAKSTVPAVAQIALTENGSPSYAGLAMEPVTLTTSWQQYTYVLTPDLSCATARLLLTNLGGAANTTTVSDFTLQTGTPGIGVPSGQSLGTMALLQYKYFPTRTRAAQQDWINFLWSTESSYWTTMRSYLKTTLGVNAPIIGTQAEYSPLGIQSSMDVVDVHSYWHQPEFPGSEWDPSNWYIQNTPMASSTSGGIIPATASARVMGMPYVCTEFNEPAPSTYTGELSILSSAYASLQDTDAIFIFCHLQSTGWARGYFNQWFEAGVEPNKAVNMAAAAAIFRSGDVTAASSSYGASVATTDTATQMSLIASLAAGSPSLGGVSGAPMIGATDFGHRSHERGPAPHGIAKRHIDNGLGTLGGNHAKPGHQHHRATLLGHYPRLDENHGYDDQGVRRKLQLYHG